MRKVFCYILLVFLVACSAEENKKISVEDHNTIQSQKVVNKLPKSVSNTVRISRHFSSPVLKDRFVLMLKGETYPGSKLYFCILNSGNDTLFYRSVSGLALLEYFNEEEFQNEEDTLRLINYRMSSFFAENNFSNPPYFFNDPTKEGFDGNVDLWNEIKNDSTSWCFEFSLLTDGASEVIAYSRARDSVMVYDASE